MPGLLISVLLALGCTDPLGPDSNHPGINAAAIPSEPTPQIRASGATGPGAPIPTADRQDFDLDVAWNLTGRLFYRDWSFVRVGGVVATITVDASDASTRFLAYRNSSTRCANSARGVEVDGWGRLDNGDLVTFTIASCDNGAGGAGDVFHMSISGAQYERGGPVSSGDVAKVGTTPATQPRVSGLGAIGPGTPTLGSDRQEFDFDLNATPGGRLDYRDYSVVRNGAAGRMIVNPPADGATELYAFHQTSAACVRISGRGRIDTGDLLLFSIDVCDNASGGTGSDTFGMFIPDRLGQGVPYVRSGSLTTGDIVFGAPPASGSLNVTTTTSGSSLDPDGYTVTLDGGNARAISINGTTTYTNLSASNHSVSLSGVAANCIVSGGTSRTVTVPSGGTASTTFAVTCGPSASALAFAVQPSETRAGAIIQPAVQIRVLDAQGNTATTYTGEVTIAISRNGGLLMPGTLTGMTSVNAVNGVATFSDLSIDRMGNGYTLRVTASGLTSAESQAFNIIL